jgi:hypothetical protein
VKIFWDKRNEYWKVEIGSVYKTCKAIAIQPEQALTAPEV